MGRGEPRRQKAAAQVIETARGLLDGRIGLIPAARALCALHWELGAETDEGLLVFVAIESETDHLPIGEERGNWDPDALRKHDEEIAEYEKSELKFALDAAKRLLTRFQGDDGERP